MMNLAMIEREKEEMTESQKKEDEKKESIYNVFPDMNRNINYDKRIITFEIALPGVKKENIKLKALPEWFYLEAKRGQLMYNANQSFGKTIVPERTTAKYDCGLLTITAHIPDPFDGAKELVF